MKAIFLICILVLLLVVGCSSHQKVSVAKWDRDLRTDVVVIQSMIPSDNGTVVDIAISNPKGYPLRIHDVYNKWEVTHKPKAKRRTHYEKDHLTNHVY